MEVASGRVAGLSPLGDREAQPKWVIDAAGDDAERYTALLRRFAKNIAKNNGSLEIGGNLTITLVPRVNTGNRPLLSPETMFLFHTFAENDNGKPKKRSTPATRTNPQLASYEYQNNLPPLYPDPLRGFMPTI